MLDRIRGDIGKTNSTFGVHRVVTRVRFLSSLVECANFTAPVRMWGYMDDDDIERLGRYLLTMRLGAIDVGSNSVHMIVADVSREGHLEVVDRVKEMVRLGRRSFTPGPPTAESMDLAVRALMNFKRLLRVRRVVRLRAGATSAVREARNRTEFIRRIKRETGLTVEVISGLDEARLIFQAARHALGLDGGPHLLVAVGG